MPQNTQRLWYTSTMSKKVKRLFEQFAPDNYDLFISISEDKKSFTGNVVITGKKVGRPSSRLTFHQNKLTINDVEVSKIDPKNNTINTVEISRIQTHASYDELRIHTSELCYPGHYKIRINFSGTITNNMDGIYPSSFIDNKIEKQLLITQFESHHARDAFPCIDEPEAKAVFQLTLEHSNQEIALSNTPEISRVQSKDKKYDITKFEPTPLMSTYLLAFVVGELKSKEAASKSGVKIRAFAIPEQVQSVDFALQTAVKSMDFYEEYYDIPFPLAKCDFVALPDFASGAMENWGLITFREQLLLCDKNTSLETKQYIAIVVAHELTHQWFGNLVTMRWWTDLWLNEGFASWMEYLAVDHQFPQWELWTQFSINEQQIALKADALEHTHPIEVPVKHPDEVRTIFDVISYQKGASVIHMLHDYLGAEPFRDGLRHYLKKHAYKNTDTVDLWQALEDIANKPVKNFMSAWTNQTGFPLLTVSNKDDHLHIEQQRFVANPRSEARKDKTLWPIPLLVPELNDSTVTKRVQNLSFKDINKVIKLNLNQTGFYRVDYSHEFQLRQLKALDKGALGNDDRMGLLSDNFEIARAGYQSVTEYLDLLEHYSDETSLAVWELLAGTLGSIRQTLSKSDDDTALRDSMKPFIINFIEKEYNRLGWDPEENENHLDSLLRPTILSLATNSDKQDAVSKALKLYESKISNNIHLQPDTRGIVYATAARLGDMKTYKELLALYNKSTSADEKLSLTGAMTNFVQPQIHKEVLELIKNGTVKLQDIGYWLAYSLMNRHARKTTWEWIKVNWKWLKKHIGTDLSFARMPVYAARNFATESELTDYKDFFKNHMETMFERSYAQGLEIIETNIEWRSRDAEAALEWFKKRND